jgi:hypothetical protein
MAFKPSKYFSSKYNSIVKSGRSVTIKGKSSSEDIVLSEDEMMQIISKLRDNEYVPIKKISGDLKVAFDTLERYIGLLHQTNTYTMLKEMIDDQFKNIDQVTPGTIGAHYRGSSLNTNMDPKECGVLAANSIPVEESSWKKCKNTVILATKNRYGYDFSLLSTGDDPSHAYVHVQHNNYDDFEGFSPDEKNKLKKYGIEYIYLHGYEDDPTKQKDLVGSAQHINDIKSKKCNSCNPGREEHSSNSGWWILGIIIFIFIIILLIAWLCC